MSMNETTTAAQERGTVKQEMNLVKLYMGEAQFALGKGDITQPTFLVNEAITKLRTIAAKLENLK